MKQAAKTRSHTFPHTHKCSAALRHFDWSSARCVFKILLSNYPWLLAHLPLPFPLLLLLLLLLPLVCVLRQNFIKANNLLTSFLLARQGVRPGTLQANEAHYIGWPAYMLYRILRLTDSTRSRHAAQAAYTIPFRAY